MNHVGQLASPDGLNPPRAAVVGSEHECCREGSFAIAVRATSVEPRKRKFWSRYASPSVLVSPLSTVRPPEPFVNADTAAAFVGITRRTLLQKVRAGKDSWACPRLWREEKGWRFKLSELDRYLCSAINSVLQPPEPANRRI